MYFAVMFRQIFLFKHEHKYWHFYPAPSDLTKSKVLLTDEAITLIYTSFYENMTYLKLKDNELWIQADAILWYNKSPQSYSEDITYAGRQRYLRIRGKNPQHPDRI